MSKYECHVCKQGFRLRKGTYTTDKEWNHQFHLKRHLELIKLSTKRRKYIRLLQRVNDYMESIVADPRKPVTITVNGDKTRQWVKMSVDEVEEKLQWYERLQRLCTANLNEIQRQIDIRRPRFSLRNAERRLLDAIKIVNRKIRKTNDVDELEKLVEFKQRASQELLEVLRMLNMTRRLTEEEAEKLAIDMEASVEGLNEDLWATLTDSNYTGPGLLDNDNIEDIVKDQNVRDQTADIINFLKLDVNELLSEEMPQASAASASAASAINAKIAAEEKQKKRAKRERGRRERDKIVNEIIANAEKLIEDVTRINRMVLKQQVPNEVLVEEMKKLQVTNKEWSTSYKLLERMEKGEITKEEYQTEMDKLFNIHIYRARRRRRLRNTDNLPKLRF